MCGFCGGCAWEKNKNKAPADLPGLLVLQILSQYLEYVSADIFGVFHQLVTFYELVWLMGTADFVEITACAISVSICVTMLQNDR